MLQKLSCFRCVWLELELNFAGQSIARSRVVHPWSKTSSAGGLLGPGLGSNGLKSCSCCQDLVVWRLGQAQRRPPVLPLIGVGVTIDEDGRERNGTLAAAWVFILTWQGRHHDQEGGSPRMRLVHCTPVMLISANGDVLNGSAFDPHRDWLVTCKLLIPSVHVTPRPLPPPCLMILQYLMQYC